MSSVLLGGSYARNMAQDEVLRFGMVSSFLEPPIVLRIRIRERAQEMWVSRHGCEEQWLQVAQWFMIESVQDVRHVLAF